MHRRIVIFAVALLALSGCGSATDSDQGEVIYHVPHVPGSEHPYAMPQLGDAPIPPPAKPRSRLTRPPARKKPAVPTPPTPAPAASEPAKP